MLNYTPLPSQLKFHRDPSQFRAIVGGIGSGKTICGCREVLRWTQRFPGSFGLIGRLTATALRDTTQRRFFEVLDALTGGQRSKLVHKWLEGQNHLWLKTSVPGVYSELLFRRLDEPGPLGSLDVDYFMIDECHEPDGHEVPEEVFLMLRGRLRGKVGPLRGIILSNSGGKDWIWKWFFSSQAPPGFWGIQVPSHENKANLPPNYIEHMVRDHPPEWVKRFIEGSFDVFEGMIFEQFNREDFVVPLDTIPPTGRIEGGFDFGVAAPTAAVIARVTPEDTIYIIDEFHKPEADIRVVADWLRTYRTLGTVWSDPTVVNRGAGKKSPRDLYAEHNVILTPAPSNEALMRISIIHQYLMRRKLFIADKCEVLIATLENSRWKPRKEGEPERPSKKKDHSRDALAYLLLGHPLGALLDPLLPGKTITHIDKRGNFRHPSLEEDEDNQDDLILSEEEWLGIM